MTSASRTGDRDQGEAGDRRLSAEDRDAGGQASEKGSGAPSSASRPLGSVSTSASSSPISATGRTRQFFYESNQRIAQMRLVDAQESTHPPVALFRLWLRILPERTSLSAVGICILTQSQKAPLS